LVSYAKQFSQNIGHDFTDRTILLTAITGGAATEIGGRTSALVFKYKRRTDHTSFKDIEFFQDTRLSYIDTISFAAYHSVLVKISENLKEFTDNARNTYMANMLSVSWETFANLKPFVEIVFTKTEMASIGNKPLTAWLNSRVLPAASTTVTT
jgi:hypothetical protein